MNGKKAKALRHLAAEMAPDAKPRVRGRNRLTGQIVVHKQSLRGVYLDLKRKFQEGKKS